MSSKSIIVRILAVASVAALSACGGGNHSVSSGGGGGGATGSAGTFVDAPVNGLTFSASPSGLTGMTNSAGTFHYMAGDTVTFSLGVGASVSAVTVGAIKPMAPQGGGNAQVFVLSLQNGLQVAQVLQSLDHSSSAGTLDPSALALSSSASQNLNAYITSGGTVLPSGQTDVMMLQAAQMSNTASGITFKNSGGASLATVACTLYTTITNASTVAGVNLPSVLPGATVFVQNINIPGASCATNTYTPGFGAFNSGGTVFSNIVASQGPTVSMATASIPANSNTVTLTGSKVDTLLMVYLDGSQVIWADTLSDGSTGSGTWNFVQTTFAQTTIASKTLTVSGILAAGYCSGVPIQLVIDSMGANFTANCMGNSTQVAGGPIAAVASMAGILSLTDAFSGSGNVYYIGLPAGSSITSGTLAVVKASTTSPGGGLTAVTAM